MSGVEHCRTAICLEMTVLNYGITMYMYVLVSQADVCYCCNKSSIHLFHVIMGVHVWAEYSSIDRWLTSTTCEGYSYADMYM